MNNPKKKGTSSYLSFLFPITFMMISILTELTKAADAVDNFNSAFTGNYNFLKASIPKEIFGRTDIGFLWILSPSTTGVTEENGKNKQNYPNHKLFSVMSDGIFFVEDVSLFYYNERINTIKLQEFYKLPKNHEITAMAIQAESETNTILIVGEGLSIADAEAPTNENDFKLKVFKLHEGKVQAMASMKSTNIGYIVRQDFDMIRFITHIPGTTIVLSSSNRYKIAKYDYASDDDPELLENPIDLINDIRITPGKEFFIATSFSTNMNYIGTFSDMKKKVCFSLELFTGFHYEHRELNSGFRVEFMDFLDFGNEPSVYAMANSNIQHLYLYNYKYRKLDGTKKVFFDIIGINYIKQTQYLYIGSKISFGVLYRIWDNSIMPTKLKYENVKRIDILEFQPLTTTRKERIMIFIEGDLLFENPVDINFCHETCQTCRVPYNETRADGGYCLTCREGFTAIDISSEDRKSCSTESKCPGSEVLHWEYHYDQDSTLVETSQVTGNEKFTCRTPYVLTQTDIDLGYTDNGCDPFYSKNNLGICQKCPDSDCSDCYSFVNFPQVCNKFNPYSYNLLNKVLQYKKKGATSSQSINFNEHLFSSGAQTILLDFGFTITKDQSEMALQNILFLSFLGSDQFYSTCKRGFITKTLSEEGEDEAIECYKQCPTGQFYLSEVMQCIQCPINCAECDSLDKCDRCDPGYNVVQDVCYKGCPIGYFQKMWNGTCEECMGECTSCIFQERCSSCLDPNKYIDERKGNCVDVCQGKGTFEEVVKLSKLPGAESVATLNNPALRDKNRDITVKRCWECDPNCSQCGTRKSCQSCSFGYDRYELDETQKNAVELDLQIFKCRKASRAIFVYLIIGGCVLLVLGLIVGIYHLLRKKETGLKKAKEEKEAREKEEQEPSILDFGDEGLQDFGDGFEVPAALGEDSRLNIRRRPSSIKYRTSTKKKVENN